MTYSIYTWQKYQVFMTLFFQNKTIKSSTRGTVELFYSTNKKIGNKRKARKRRGVQEAGDEGGGRFTGSGRQNTRGQKTLAKKI